MTNSSRFTAKNNAQSFDIFEVYASGASEGTVFRTSGSGGTMLTVDSLNNQINAESPITSSGTLSVSNTTISTGTSTGALLVSGGVGIAGALNVGATMTISNTTNAVSTSSASLVTMGGLSVAKDLYVVGSVNATGGIDANTQRIRNVPLPSVSTDAASKQYVDNVAAGLDAKMSVVAATTGPEVLANILDGYAIDGHTLATGERLLVKDQSTGTENGIYIVGATGPPVRSSDFAVGASVAGSYFFVESGTVNAKTGYVVINASGSDVVGTDAIVFSPFTGAADIIAGDGLTKTGNRLDASVDAQHLEIVADKIRISTAAAGTGLTGGGNVALAVATSLTHVTEIGTLTTGTWNASTIGVPYGGTGANSHYTGGILIGNSTSAIQSSSALTFTGGELLTTPSLVATKRLQVTSTGAISGARNTQGVFMSIPDKVYTDNVTTETIAVDGTSGTYFGVPTFAATNAGVNYEKSATITIGGAPLAGTNITLLNNAALRVLSGSVQIEDTTDTTLSAMTGALAVAGGISVGKRLWVSQGVTADAFSGRLVSGPASENAIYLGTNYAGSSNVTAVYANGTFEVYTGGLINAQVARMSVNSSGRVTISNTTSSVGTGSGALDVAGGIYAGNNSVINGTLSLTGNATVGGTLAVTGNVVLSSDLSMLNIPTGVRVAVSSNSNAPIITRTRNTFTSGAYTGAGRWGLFAETASLSLGLPAGEALKWSMSTYNADSTIATEWFSVSAQTGQVAITATTNVTASNTGALVVSGGQYIEKNLWVNDSVYVANDILIGTVGSFTDDNTSNLKLSASSGDLLLTSTGSIHLESSQQVIFSQGLQLPTLSLGKASGSILVPSVSHGVIFNTDPTTTLSVASSGTHMSVYAMRSLGIDSVAAQSLTRASTVYIQGAPTVGSSNLTVGDLYAMYVSSGKVYFGDTNEASVTSMGGIRVTKTLSAGTLTVDASDTYTLQLGTITIKRLPIIGGGYENHIQSTTTGLTTFSDLVFSDPNTNASIATIKNTGLTIHGTTSGSITTLGGVTVAGSVSAASMTLSPTGVTRIGLNIGSKGVIQNLSVGALGLRVMNVPNLTVPVADDPTVYTHRQIVNSSVDSIDMTSAVWPLNDGTATTINANYTMMFFGYVKPTYSETFTFYLTLQNCAAKLLVDHEGIVVNYTANTTQTTYSGTFDFASDTEHVPLILLVQCFDTPSRVLLEWSSVSQLRETIPSAQLAFSAHEDTPVTHGPMVVGSDALFTDKVTFADNVTFNGTASIGANLSVDSIAVKNYTVSAEQLPIESTSETLLMLRGPAVDPMGALPLVNTNLAIASPTGTSASNPGAYFRVFSNVGPVNTSQMVIGWNPSASQYVIKAQKSAAGSLYPMVLGDSLTVSTTGVISIGNTVDSSSTSTGAMVVAGGVAVAKNLTVGLALEASTVNAVDGTVKLGTATNGTNDTGLSRGLYKDTTTLVVNYQGDFVGGVRVDSPMTINNTTSSALVVLGGLTVSKSVSLAGPLLLPTDPKIIHGSVVPASVTSVTDLGLYSMSTTNKTIRLMTDAGSVKFYSSSNSSADVTISATTVASSIPINVTDSSSTSIQTSGGMSATGSISVGGDSTTAGTSTALTAVVTSTTDATSTASLASLQVAGGAVIQKNLYSGTKMSAGGLVEIRGTTAMVDISAGALAIPSLSVRSNGTRVLLQSTVGASTLDTAIGTSSSGAWFSLADTSNSLKVYAGADTQVPWSLSGSGQVTHKAIGSVQITEFLGYSSVDIAPYTDNSSVSTNYYLTATKTGTPWSAGVNSSGKYVIGYTSSVIEATQSGTVNILTTTNTSSSTTGALVVSGGLAVAKDLGVFGNQTVTGTLTLDTIQMNTASPSGVLMYTSGATRLRSASSGGLYVNDLAVGNVIVDSASSITNKVSGVTIATLSSTAVTVTKDLSMTTTNAVFSTLSTVDGSITTSGGIIADRISTTAQIRTVTQFAMAPTSGVTDATIGVTGGNVLSISSPGTISLTGNTSIIGTLSTSGSLTAQSVVGLNGLKTASQPMMVYTLVNSDGVNKQWFYLGTLNTTTGSVGLTEKGALGVRLVNTSGNKASVLYWNAQVNSSGPSVVASHWYSASSSISSGNGGRVVVYNNGSGDYHVFVQLPALGNSQVIVDHGTSSGLLFPAVSEGTSSVPSGSYSGYSAGTYTVEYDTDSSAGTGYLSVGTLATSSGITAASLSVSGTVTASTSVVTPVVNSTTGGSLALQVSGSSVAVLQSGTVTLSGSLVAGTTGVYDIGSNGTRFKDMYLSGNATVGGAISGASLTTTGATTIGGTLTIGSSVITDGLRNTTSDASAITIAPVSLLHVKGLLETSRGLIVAPSGSSRAPSATAGQFVEVSAGTFNDTTTLASGTAEVFNATYFGVPTISAVNSSVVTPVANSVYIAGAPVAGANQTITNGYALQVASGRVLLGSTVTDSLVASGGITVTKDIATRGVLFNTVDAVGDVATIGTSTSGSKTTIVARVGSDTSTGANAGFTVVHASLTLGDLTLTNMTRDMVVFAPKVSVTDTTESASIGTGSLILAGGASVAKALRVGGTIYSNDLQISSSSLTLNGGASTVLSVASGQLLVNPSASLASGVVVQSALNVSVTTASTSSTSGCLTLAGGLGVAGRINSGGALWVQRSNTSPYDMAYAGTFSTDGAVLPVDTVTAAANRQVLIEGTINDAVLGLRAGQAYLWDLQVSASSGALNLTSVNIAGNSAKTALTIANGTGVLSVTSTVDSSSTSTGALTVTGGLAVAKTLNVGTAITLTRNVNGGASMTVVNPNTGTSAWAQYTLQNDTGSVATLMFNSSGRTVEGGSSALSLVNTSGNIRLATVSGSAMTVTDSSVTFDRTPVNVAVTTDASSTSSGSLVIAGGLAVAKKIQASGSGIVLNGASSGAVTVKSASTTDTFTLTVPIGLPPLANSSLIADLSGNLSWGTPLAAAGSTSGTIINTFHGVDNQSSPANINGLLFNGGSFVLYVRVEVDATVKLVGSYELRGVYDGTTWTMIVNKFKDDPAVTFTITSAGQVQYTSGSYAGFNDLIFSWEDTLTSESVVNRLEVGEDLVMDLTAGYGAILTTKAGLNFTDNGTSASGTRTNFDTVLMNPITLLATSSSVTTTNASTFTIGGAPIVGTNQTITNASALRVMSGVTRLEDTTQSTSTTSGALVVAGGVAVAKNFNVGGSLTSNGGIKMGSTGSLVSKKLFGNVSIGANGSQSIAVSITFSSAMSSTNYTIIGNVASSTTSATDIFVVSFSDLTTSGCVAHVYLVNGSSWSDVNVRLGYSVME